MGKCPQCGAAMQQLFTSMACAAECDLKKATKTSSADWPYWWIQQGAWYTVEGTGPWLVVDVLMSKDTGPCVKVWGADKSACYRWAYEPLSKFKAPRWQAAGAPGDTTAMDTTPEPSCYVGLPQYRGPVI